MTEQIEARDPWHTKYRPRKFEDVVGHSMQVRMLSQMIKKKEIPSTILFDGSYGCGKTTLARLFARYVNCEKFKACGKCESCTMMSHSSGHPDFTEINMADVRGIDGARDIIRIANLAPMIGRMRVFLLDECHQWTPQAAQLFLKPLEEPPAKTLWMLATSEPQKLPATVMSRCTRVSLSELGEEDILARLKKIASEEKVKLKDKILKKIVTASGGHVRDAIQTLESVCRLLPEDQNEKEVDKIVERVTLSSMDLNVEKVAARILAAIYLIYNRKDRYKIAVETTAGVEKESFVPVMNRCISLHQYIIDKYAMGGGPGIWNTPQNRRFLEWNKKEFKNEGIPANIGTMLEMMEVLLDMRTAVMYATSHHRSVLLSKIGALARKIG